MTLIERLRSDWIYGLATARLLWRLRRILRRPRRTFADQIGEIALRHPDKPALIDEDGAITYRALMDLSARYARWARSIGVAKGDVVGLMMLNRPEYLAAWIGVSRVGGVTALINTNQRGESLAHSIRIVGLRHLILDAELAEEFETARGLVDPAVTVWARGGEAADARSLDQALADQPDRPLGADERAAQTIDDPCLYIYTSGTTGLPKAATITHYRVLVIANGFSSVMRSRADDRIYVPLPLYHSSGGVLGVGAALSVGGTAIIRKRFSAGAFWRDCVTHKATMFQYIGELCRYLINAPPCEEEKQHTIRLACGNGLRPEIWRPFQERFGLGRIVEFYGATEGNVVLVNHDGHEGALGRLPGWARAIFHVELVRFDHATGAPARDARGRCMRCKAGEIGEAIGSIERDPKRPTSRFDGYANAEETERKILRDVFAEGDLWFRTGDLMRIDEGDYVYFVDRIGDTFRWKGENVSTAEVATAISHFDDIGEASVYGVAVPGHEGRAGMAVIVSHDPAPDLAGLARHLEQTLPDYARPVFLRVARDIEKTSTFKQRKMSLVDDGFDPRAVDDALYFLDARTGTYLALDAEAHARICSGEIRL